MPTALEVLEKFGQRLDTMDTRSVNAEKQVADVLKALSASGGAKIDASKPADSKPLSVQGLLQLVQDNKVVNQDGSPVALEAIYGEMGIKLSQGRMIANTVAQLDRMFMGLPIGSGVVGGFLGVLADQGVNRFAPERTLVPTSTINFVNAAAKGALAWVIIQWGPQWIGRPASLFAAGYLALRIGINVAPQVFEDLVNTILDFFKKPPDVPPLGSRVSFGQLGEFAPIGHNGFSTGVMTQNFPVNQVIPGFGGAGSNPLDYVFSPN